MSTIRVNQVQDTSTNVAANISGGVVAFNNTPTFASGADPFNSVIETWYYHTGDIAEGNNAVLDQTWYRKTNHGAANKNGGMSATSGVWTFPSTGIWQTTLIFNYFRSNASLATGVTLEYTSDNSANTDTVLRMYNNFYAGSANSSITMPYTFNITDTSNQKFFYTVYGDNVTVRGGTDHSTTLLQFIKLCPSV